MIYDETVNVSSSDYKCGSCTLCIVSFVVFLVTSVIISAVLIYVHWYLKESNDQLYLKKDNVRIKLNPSTQTTIYCMQIC